MARPSGKIDNPAKNHANFLFTDKQMEMLEKCAYELRMSKTDIVRMGIERIYNEVMAKEK